MDNPKGDGVVFIICSIISEPEAAAEVARHLIERGIRVDFVCERLAAAERLRQLGFSAVYFWDPAETPSEAEVARAAPAISDRAREIARPELHYLHWQVTPANLTRLESRAREAAARMLVVLERIRPALVVNNDGSEIIRRVSSDVASYLGISSFYLGVAPFPGRMGINRDHHGIWLDNDDVVGDFDAAAFVDQMIAKKPVFYVNKTRETRAAKGLRYARRLIAERGEAADSVYHRTAWDDLRLGMEMRARGLSSRRFYAPLPDRRFVYFPMHVANDTQVTVRAYPYAAQNFLVDMISRSLPDDLVLVVKEHPFGVGLTPQRDLEDIAATDRVVLVAPENNSYDLVRRCEAVVVLNSTVGFESILNRKPTVVLSRPYYAGRGVTIDVPDPHGLRDAIREAVALRELSLEQVYAALEKLWCASWPGMGLGFAFDTMAFEHPGAAATAGTVHRLYELARAGRFPRSGEPLNQYAVSGTPGYEGGR